jgi:REP element-mobilizing transposase RayT
VEDPFSRDTMLRARRTSRDRPRWLAIDKLRGTVEANDAELVRRGRLAEDHRLALGRALSLRMRNRSTWCVPRREMSDGRVIALFKMTSKPRKHGGKRRGAGRPRRRFRVEAPHRPRTAFYAPAPVHITMRCPHLAALRQGRVYEVLCEVLARCENRDDFRVVHLSIQSNHLHLVAEANSSAALESGMRSFSINAARAINAAFRSTGRVFARYHSTVIRNRRYARSVIAYVLGNWRRHREDSNGPLTAMLDQYSSAILFDGWSYRFTIPANYRPLPVAKARTYLLSNGWAFDGPLDPWHVPGRPW